MSGVSISVGIVGSVGSVGSVGIVGILRIVGCWYWRVVAFLGAAFVGVLAIIELGREPTHHHHSEPSSLQVKSRLCEQPEGNQMIFSQSERSISSVTMTCGCAVPALRSWSINVMVGQAMLDRQSFTPL
jgi:hypothetical protein